MIKCRALALATVWLGLVTLTGCVDTPSPGGTAQCCQAASDCADGFDCTNGVCSARCQSDETCSFSQVCSTTTRTCIPAHAIPNPCGTGAFGDNPHTVTDGSVNLDATPGVDVPVTMRDASSEDHFLPPDDAGIPDAARPDGAVITDAGQPDGAMPPDAGRPDASRPDAGQPDAATHDSGPLPCTGIDPNEPNDNVTTASALNGDVGQGVLCGRDQDWFVVNSNPGDEVTVSLTLLQDAPLTMSLLSQNGQVIGQAAQTGPRSWSLFATATNRTFLQLAAPSTSDVQYTMRVTVTPTNTCRPDAFEPNNQRMGAPLVSGPVVASICPQDQDWFTVVVAEPGMTITVDMVPAPNAGDLDMELVDPNGTRVGISQGPQGSTERISMVLPQVGAYAVRIYPFGNAQGSYTLTVDLRPGGGQCMDDGFEPNDTPASASGALQVGGAQPLQGTLCPNNSDAFVLRAPQSGPLSVDLVGTGGPIQIQLLDTNGQLLAQDINDGSGQTLTRVSTQANVGSLVFVQLDGLQTPPGGVSYVLIASQGAQCGEDPNEPNNSQFEPTQVVGNTSGVTCSGDEDWFFTQGNVGDDVTASVDFPLPGLSLDIWDLGPNGPFLAAQAVPGPGGLRAQWRDTQGALLVRVTGQGSQSIPYGLTVTRGGGTVCQQDFFEPNENRLSATPYNGQASGFICVGDRDFFQVNVPSPGLRVNVQLFPTGPGGDLNVRVYDPNGALVGAGSNPAGVPENLDVMSNVRGPYSVEVFGAPEGSMNAGTGSYALQLTVQGGMTCVDDFYEPNNSQQASTQLGFAPVSLDGTLCPNDRDFYALQFNAGDTISVVLNYTPDQRMRLTALSANGQQLGDSNTGSGSEFISATAPNSGTVFLRIQGPPTGPTGRSYQLSVTTTAAQCMGDFGEPNDDPMNATVVPNTGNVSAVMCRVPDIDFYLFNGNPGRTEEVTLLPGTSASTPVDFSILDSSFTEVASTFGQPGPLKVARVDIFQPGPYWVQVFNSAGIDQAIPYNLVFREVAQAVCVDDSAEPNNSAQQAALRSTNLDIVGIACPANVDFYAFDLRANIQQTITLTNNSAGDGLFELLDPNGVTVLSTGFANFQPISFRTPRAGRYFVRITYGMAPSAGDRYVLRVSP